MLVGFPLRIYAQAFPPIAWLSVTSQILPEGLGQSLFFGPDLGTCLYRRKLFS